MQKPVHEGEVVEYVRETPKWFLLARAEIGHWEIG